MDFNFLDKENDKDIQNLIYSYLPRDSRTQITRKDFKDEYKVVYTIKTQLDDNYYYQIVLIKKYIQKIYNEIIYINKINKQSNKLESCVHSEINTYRGKYIETKKNFLEELNELLTRCFKNIYADSFSAKWFDTYEKIENYCGNLLKDNEVLNSLIHAYDHYRFFIDISYKELPHIYDLHIEVISFGGEVFFNYMNNYGFRLGIYDESYNFTKNISINELYDELIYTVPEIIKKMTDDRHNHSLLFKKAIDKSIHEDMIRKSKFGLWKK